MVTCHGNPSPTNDHTRQYYNRLSKKMKAIYTIGSISTISRSIFQCRRRISNLLASLLSLLLDPSGLRSMSPRSKEFSYSTRALERPRSQIEINFLKCHEGLVKNSWDAVFVAVPKSSRIGETFGRRRRYEIFLLVWHGNIDIPLLLSTTYSSLNGISEAAILNVAELGIKNNS